MRRALPVLTAALLGLLVSCSKADSSKNTGNGAPVNDPGRTVVADKGPSTEGAAMPVDNPPPSGPDDSYQVETAEATGASGGENVARVTVRPGKGFHMNKDYPTKLTLQLPAGVTSPKEVLLPDDAEAFSESQLAFAVKLTAAGKGDYTIPATLKFAVCTDSTCNPKKQSIALMLKAQ